MDLSTKLKWWNLSVFNNDCIVQFYGLYLFHKSWSTYSSTKLWHLQTLPIQLSMTIFLLCPTIAKRIPPPKKDPYIHHSRKVRGKRTAHFTRFSREKQQIYARENACSPSMKRLKVWELIFRHYLTRKDCPKWTHWDLL